MSEFSQAMSGVFATSQQVFGETVSIAGQDYTVVFHALEGREGIDRNLAGRQQSSSGSVFLSDAQWADVKARLTAQGKPLKGIRVTHPVAGTFRVINDPDINFEDSAVELVLGPLT